MKKLNVLIYKKWKAIHDPFLVWLCCLLVAALFLLVGTKSSPLYPLNDWVDANAFFTMGKGMMSGKILYRDLFEQKGPLLYFFYGISYLFSNRTFIGVFIIEVIFFSIFLYYAYKTIRLFVRKNPALFCIPLAAFYVINLKSFFHGGSAEELCLPFLMFNLFLMLKMFKCESEFNDKNFFLIGLTAGCVFWIKFSLIGFWVGLVFIIFIIMIINNSFFKSVRFAIIFFIGFFVSTLPWLIYFGLNNAIFDWLYTYILINIRIYPKTSSLFQSLQYTFSQLVRQYNLNPVLSVMLWLGMICFLSSKKFIPFSLKRFGILISYGLLILGIYAGGRGFVYSSLIGTPFIVLGIIVGITLIDKNSLFENIKIGKPIIYLSAVALLFITTLYLNQNNDLLLKHPDDLYQYRFASIINASDDPTLLNYDSLDLGVYTTTGIIPNIRFFEKQNLSYSKFPLNEDEQDRYIREKSIDYVVMQLAVDDESFKSNKLLQDNYFLISSATQFFEGNEYAYLLFKKKN